MILLIQKKHHLDHYKKGDVFYIVYDDLS